MKGCARGLCRTGELPFRPHAYEADMLLTELSHLVAEDLVHLLWLYSLVCVKHARKPQQQFFGNAAHMRLWIFDFLITII